MRIFNRDNASSARQLPVRTALNAEDPTLSFDFNQWKKAFAQLSRSQNHGILCHSTPEHLTPQAKMTASAKTLYCGQDTYMKCRIGFRLYRRPAFSRRLNACTAAVLQILPCTAVRKHGKTVAVRLTFCKKLTAKAFLCRPSIAPLRKSAKGQRPKACENKAFSVHYTTLFPRCQLTTAPDYAILNVLSDLEKET